MVADLKGTPAWEFVVSNFEFFYILYVYSTLQTAERDTPCTVHPTGGLDGCTLHVCNAYGGEGNTLHVHAVSSTGLHTHVHTAGSGEDTSSTTKLEVMEGNTHLPSTKYWWCKWIHPTSTLLTVKDTRIHLHVLIAGSRDGYTCTQCCGWSGIGCLFNPWIRDLGWVKNQDPDPGRTTWIIFPRA